MFFDLRQWSKNKKNTYILSFGFYSGCSGLVRFFFSFLEDYECEFRQNNYEIITKENYQ